MKKGTPIPENRNFKMHPDLLWSVIKSQAGTIDKAILEAVMNAVDAGASKCEIVLENRQYTIVDDGKGFVSRTEIEEFFETFGTPHSEGDATYGRFRMGRGQLFAFSRTVWTSGEFKMDVDIKNMGLSYKLETGQPIFKGCRIEGFVYEPTRASEIISLSHTLKELVRYMQIPVFLNGTKLNKDLSETKWTEETDDAYIHVKPTGGLTVYNLGALVRTYPAHTFGISGTIVSKVPLSVNFARNDILTSGCPVWKRIQPVLKKYVGETTRKKSMTDSEREIVARNLIRGDINPFEAENVNLVVDVTGRNRSIKDLRLWKKIALAEDEKDYLKGEKVMQGGLAFVIRKATLGRFGVDSLEELVETLGKIYSYRGFPEVVALASLTKHMSSTYEIVDIKTLTKHQKSILGGLENAGWNISKGMGFSESRKILPGKSDVASAWTDGKEFIAVDISVLNGILGREFSISAAVALLVHEYCHDTADDSGHGHTPEFYQKFHDYMSKPDVLYGSEGARHRLLNRCANGALALGIKPAKNIMGAIKKEGTIIESAAS